MQSYPQLEVELEVEQGLELKVEVDQKLYLKLELQRVLKPKLALELELELELLDAGPLPPSTARASSSTCSPTASSIFITALLCAARSSSSFPNDCFSFALFSRLF